jgi:hypothetical protein
MAEEVYTDPSARAAVLGLEGSPENQQIASAIMTQGLSSIMQAEDPGTGIPTEMPPTEMPPTGAPGLSDRDTVDLDTAKRAEGELRDGTRAEWVLQNENKRVPWDPNITWGAFLSQIFEKAEQEEPGSGSDAVSRFVDPEIQRELIEADPNQQQIRTPEVPVLPLPGNNEQQMAAAAGNIAAAEAPPPMAPVADQQGIMAAANGGIVGFNLGGMNQGGMNQAAVSEEEFMNVLNAEATKAGVSPEQMAAVTEVATNTAGGPMAANDNVMDTGIMQNVEAVDATEADLTGIGSLAEISSRLVDSGEEGLAHVSPGELIFDPRRLNEPDQRMLLAALETAGIDPESATYGNAGNILNEMTGLPAFLSFGWVGRTVRSIGRGVKSAVKGIGKGLKKVGKFLKNNASTILGIAGAMTGNPWLAALGSGIGKLIEGEGIRGALISAGMSFVGTKWVGPWIGRQLSAAAPSIFGQTVGNVAADASGSLGAGTGITSGLRKLATEGATATAVQQTALEAGTKVALEKGTTEMVQSAVQNSLAGGAAKALSAGTATFTDAAIKETAQSITNKIVADQAGGILGKAVTSTVGAALPSGLSAMGSTGAQLASTSLGQLAGGALSSAGMAYGQQQLEASQFASAEEEAAALAAWNERYDYVPSAQELYQFYTTEFTPGQQVDTGIIAGLPGYGAGAAGAGATGAGATGQSLMPNSLGIFSAAGGGYVNGIGGPKDDSNLARLSDGEFVMTERAVRGAGYGDRMNGAARMHDIMQGFERSAA